MSRNKQRRTRSVEISRRNRKKNEQKAKQKRELLKLNSKKLIKLCKQYKVTYVKNKKKETVDKIFEAMQNKKNKKNKKRKKVKKLSLTLNADQMKEFKQEAKNSKQTTNNLLLQSITTEIKPGLPPLNESNENKSAETQHTYKKKDVSVNDNKTNTHMHKKRKSIIDLIAHAPKLDYPITDMHGFDTIKDIKEALPVDVQTTQCKLFYGGKELDDDKTIAQLQIVDGSELNVLLSWKHFRPDPNSHPKTMEHRHYNKVAELKRLNNLDIFSKLVIGIQRKCNKDAVFTALGDNEQNILHEYCICLSGDRTYDREWTKLHSLCYDYQNDIGMMVDLLKKHNLDNDIDDKKQDEKERQEDNKTESLYIDAWPHSGYDTPLKMAIQRANPKEVPRDVEEEKMNEINAIAAVELVEFLVLNGARRRIGLILTNLERKGDDDHTYPLMDEEIREKLIAILKPYEEEDPWKPGT